MPREVGSRSACNPSQGCPLTAWCVVSTDQVGIRRFLHHRDMAGGKCHSLCVEQTALVPGYRLALCLAPCGLEGGQRWVFLRKRIRDLVDPRQDCRSLRELNGLSEIGFSMRLPASGPPGPPGSALDHGGEGTGLFPRAQPGDSLSHFHLR